MAFSIPNEVDALHSDQAEVDSKDWAMLVQGIGGSGVVSGCFVTAQASPDMTVVVNSGVVCFQDTFYTVSLQNATITTANATNPRFDLITYTTSSTIAVSPGTPAANPVFPTPPAGVILAAVYVPANDTAIQSNQIIDKRVFVTDTPAWTSFTPALTAATTNPNLGTTPTKTGGYKRIGNTVYGDAFIQWDSAGSPTSGTGIYTVSLPVTPAARYGTGQIIGTMRLRDNSATQVKIASLRANGTFEAHDMTAQVSSGSPWTWGASDSIGYTFQYEV